MKIEFQTSGVCCRKITLEVDENNIIQEANFEGGCNGNLGGISRLIVGQDAKEVAEKLEGTTCRSMDTSCPDQLAKAINQSL
ncbi:TIGR03905 family TSCPD domain-containing protein [Terrisporobacter sp.]